MNKDDVAAWGELLDRVTRLIMTLMFGAAICWIALRSITNISADQFVGIVMAVVLFWFGSRPITQRASDLPGAPQKPPETKP